MRRLPLVAPALLAGAGLLLFMALRPAPGPAAPGQESSPAVPARPLPMKAPGPEVAALQDSAPARAASLQGSDWDGDWALDPGSGLPMPSLRLRQRFDHLLSQLGERPLSAIRAQLQQRLQADRLSPAAQAAVLARFDAYLAVQQFRYLLAVDLQQPHSWAAALAERQRVRRQLLGAAWAEAFYGDEERALQRSLAQLRGEVQAAPEPEPPRHPQAAEREAAAEAAWAQWEQRLATARTHWAQLQAEPSLSAPQREAQWSHYLQQRFDASEALRVRGLVAQPG